MNFSCDGNIIVKSDKMWIVFAFILCITSLWFICLLADGSSEITLIYLAVFCLSILCFQYWVALGRTLKMNARGCEVTFLFISRFYEWQELEIRFENYSHRLSNRQPYSEGIIFYPKKISKPDWMLPATYCLFVHPFKFFFVNFKPRKEYGKWVVRYPELYEVDKVKFMGCLKNWGVSVNYLK